MGHKRLALTMKLFGLIGLIGLIPVELALIVGLSASPAVNSNGLSPGCGIVSAGGLN